jgi:hypothetical protein
MLENRRSRGATMVLPEHTAGASERSVCIRQLSIDDIISIDDIS